MPNIFEIAVSENIWKEIQIRGFQSAFGESNDDFVFFKDIAIGVRQPISDYHLRFNVNLKGFYIIDLLRGPNEVLLEQIVRIIDELKPSFVFYELDCDQNDFHELDSSKYHIADLIDYNLVPKNVDFRAFVKRNNEKPHSIN
ncbi:MAG: hypothetical protein KDC92_05860 [Bacteroidetes bacterium]|nr:hypothetical protein [Bacteroidota bacterium]